MKPPFPSPTPTWHNDTYPAIDPKNNSHAGKTVIVTGAGSGIGRETAITFAQAGAKHIVLVGRTESKLLESQKLLPSGLKSTVCAASVADVGQMQKVAEAAGTWDVFVLNAGHIAKPASIKDSDLSDWWMSYETNVKAIMIAAKLFLPNANPSGAAMIAVTAGGIVLAPNTVAGCSAYMSSKVAQVKVMEWLGVENPNIFTCSVHPGVVDTQMLTDSGLTGLPFDTPQLPAHFIGWLAQPKAAFLKNRFVWCNWDADELCGLQDRITSSDIMTMNTQGWPYSYDGDITKVYSS